MILVPGRKTLLTLIFTGNVLNPFNPSTNERFPSIEAQNTSSQQLSYAQPQFTNNQSQAFQPQYQMQQQQPPQASTSSGGFQPSSNFGQALQYQMTGIPNNHSFQDLDPYSSLGQFHAQQAQQAQQAQFHQMQAMQQAQNSQPMQSTQNHTISMTSYAGKTHPRDIVKNRKEDLESWNMQSWKSLDNALKELKSAWEKRKQQIYSALDGQMGRPLMQDELSRFQSVRYMSCSSSISVFIEVLIPFCSGQ